MELTVERTDGAVRLPKTSANCIVVADLSTMRTDIVLGEELIAAVGGINLKYDKGFLSSVTFGERPDLPIPVSNPSSMGGQEHIPELKHTPVASETKPEVITNDRQLNGKSASVLPKPQQPAERVASSDDAKQDDVASTLIASSTTSRNIATASKTVNVSAIPVRASSTGNPDAPTPKVVDNVGLPDSPRSQTGDVDRAMLGHSHPKQLDSSGDLPYQSRIAARHPFSLSLSSPFRFLFHSALVVRWRGVKEGHTHSMHACPTHFTHAQYCYRTPRVNTSSQPIQQTLNTSLPNSKLSLFTSLVVSQKTKQHGALVITQCVLCMRKVCRACVHRVCRTFLHNTHCVITRAPCCLVF